MCPQDILHHKVIIRCSPVVNLNSKNLSLENQIFGATARVVFHFVGIAQGLNLISCLVGGYHTTPHRVVKGMLCGLIVSKSKFLFSSRAHLQFHTATISREHQHQVCVGIPLLSPSWFPMSHSSAEKKSVWAGRVCLLMGGTSERK